MKYLRAIGFFLGTLSIYIDEIKDERMAFTVKEMTSECNSE